MVSKHKYSENKGKNKEFLEILKKIEKVDHWSEYDIYELAKMDGDAYKIAYTIKKGVETTQLRKFYNEALKGYYALFHPSRRDDIAARTALAMLSPRAHYARQRKTISQEFLDFIKKSTDLSKFRVNNIEEFKKDYERFLQFFEAVVGYHKFFSKSEER